MRAREGFSLVSRGWGRLWAERSDPEILTLAKVRVGEE
ncbi:MAG: hypothetical protein UV32_C0012G0007 [Candidatus Collierbacteria bacterium GW2011_GWF2_42_51]|nr:MAG: hypothetical protein UV32_C0012G0007 [Candidatus Collierbacteria bacterium GW2011_GWF2_42_51]